MEIAIKIVVILHLVGMAMIVGGALYQMNEKAKRVSRVMVDGAYAQLVTGIALVGLVQANHEDLDMAAVAVKLAIALAVAVICFANRKNTAPATAAWAWVLALALVNVTVAVFRLG